MKAQRITDTEAIEREIKRAVRNGPARKAKAIQHQQDYEKRVSAKAGRPMREIKLFVSADL